MLPGGLAKRESRSRFVSSQIQAIKIDRLHVHPHNPRLRLRDDVVTQIAAEITRSGFGPEHALLVRPVGDGFEILSGHHRTEAARRVGLDTVPAWVREMDDDEAFMTLILANTQGELSPLEEGHHVHYFVERGKIGAGRGNTGGLREYARRLNKGETSLRERRDAYRVYEKCALSAHFSDGSYKHLYEISKAPEESWPPLAAALAEKRWSVKDTARAVGEVAKFAVPAEHSAWLPIELVTDSLRQRRDAYRVYEKCRDVSAFSGDEFQHLYAISKAAAAPGQDSKVRVRTPQGARKVLVGDWVVWRASYELYAAD